MTEFEHLMLLACFSVSIGTTIGNLIGFLIGFIYDLISKRRAKKCRLKETNDK